MKKIISLQNVKCRCPKNNPILERQSLLQLVQTKQEGRDEVEATLSLRRALFPAVCRDSSLSAKQMPLCTELSPAVAIISSWLPDVGVNVAHFHVAFANILEPEHAASRASGASGKLAIEEVFGNSAIVHAPHVTKPAKASLAQEGEHVGDSSPG